MGNTHIDLLTLISDRQKPSPSFGILGVDARRCGVAPIPRSFHVLKLEKKTVGLKKEPVYTVYASGIFFVWKNKWDTRVTFLSW